LSDKLAIAKTKAMVHEQPARPRVKSRRAAGSEVYFA
jgi:hypothetical protein